MGKITDYSRVSSLLKENVLLIDGAGRGTHTITAKDIAIELLKLLDSKQQVSQLNMDDLDQITSMLPTDKVLVGTESGVKAMSAKDALFDVLDIDSTISLEMRKNYFRGKNLGSVFTDDQRKEIRDGTFRDLFPGDYWEKDGIQWRIVDIDYYMDTSDNLEHHVLIMPDQILCEKALFSENSITNNMYSKSKFYNDQSYAKAEIFALMRPVFANDDLDIYYPAKHYLINGYDSNNHYATAGAEVYEQLYCPNLAQISGLGGYAVNILFEQKRLIEYPDTIQFDLFRIAPKYIKGKQYTLNNIEGYFTRDVSFTLVNRVVFYAIQNDIGVYDAGSGNSNFGVRPVFGITGNVHNN